MKALAQIGAWHNFLDRMPTVILVSPLLNHFLLTKDRSFYKNLLESKEVVFKSGVENVQATGCNGVCTVIKALPMMALCSLHDPPL